MRSKNKSRSGGGPMGGDSEGDALVSIMVQDMRRAGIPVVGKPPAIFVEANGVPMFVRPMTAIERAAYYRWLAKTKGKRSPFENAVQLWIRGVCCSDGNLIHTEAEASTLADEIDPTMLAAVAPFVVRINRLA